MIKFVMEQDGRIGISVNGRSINLACEIFSHRGNYVETSAGNGRLIIDGDSVHLLADDGNLIQIQ